MRRPKLPEPYQFERRLHAHLPIYAAMDTRSGRPVVIKRGSDKSTLLGPDARRFRDRLSTEARSLRRWERCPNVVRLVEERLDDHPPFLVLERLGTSAERESADETLPLDEVLDVVSDVALALIDIHSIGDAHYDVKPDNILRHPFTGRWTLIDPGEPELTTMEYAAENVRGWEADILALGRTVLALLQGVIEEQVDEFIREGLELEDEGDRFVRLVDRMLWHPRSRYRCPGARPTARQAVDVIRKVKAGRQP
jgi:serine/threonine protein kinase